MGSEDGSKDADSTSKKDNSLCPRISLVDSDDGRRNETDIEIIMNCSDKNSKSSISSDSLAEDTFLMDAEMVKKYSSAQSASLQAHGDFNTWLVDNTNGVSGNMSCRSEEPGYDECSLAFSLVSDITHESSSRIMSPVQSPPIQVMERSGDFVANRIPASACTSRPSTAADWSVASNDSLFSIQIGNSSFSTEQFLMMNGELGKYEPHKFREPYRSGEIYKSDIGGNCEETGEPAKTMKDLLKVNVNHQVEGKSTNLDMAENSSAVNACSDGSSTKCQFFACPIKKRCGWSECPNSDCSCTGPKCWCRWPTCFCCRPPSCPCCSQPSFFCCRCPSCSCFRWPSCSFYKSFEVLPLKWTSCKCHNLNCSWTFCFSWNFFPKIMQELFLGANLLRLVQSQRKCPELAGAVLSFLVVNLFWRRCKWDFRSHLPESHADVYSEGSKLDAIDSALRRAGRFDAEIEVTTPTEDERFQILKLYTKKLPLDPTVDLQAIAASCSGYVGADLEALCREAAMPAVAKTSDENRDTVMYKLTMDDRNHAKFLVGPSITRGVTVEIPKVSWYDIRGLKD